NQTRRGETRWRSPRRQWRWRGKPLRSSRDLSEESAAEVDEAGAAFLEILELVVGRCAGRENDGVEAIGLGGKPGHGCVEIGGFENGVRLSDRAGGAGEALAGDRQGH